MDINSSSVTDTDPVIILSFFLVTWMFIVQLMFPSRLGVEVYGVEWIQFFGFSGQHIIELVLSSISHGSMSHLIGNLYGLLLFAIATNRPLDNYSYLEVFGLFISIGIISNGLAFLLYSAALGYPINIIGSSGAVIGLYGYHMAKYITKLDIETQSNSYIPTINYELEDVNQYLLVGFTSFYIILTVQQQLTTGLASIQTAHLAHIIGFVFGGLIFLVEYYASENKEEVNPFVYE